MYHVGLSLCTLGALWHDTNALEYTYLLTFFLTRIEQFLKVNRYDLSRIFTVRRYA